MKASFKDRGILILLLIVFIFVVSSLVYFAFAKPKITGVLTSSEIIKTDNLQQIEIYKKYGTPYAFKVQDNNKYYLRYFHNENNKPAAESKYELTKEQYDKLVEGNKYWFMVKFSKAGNTNTGIVKDILTEDHARK